MVGLTDDGRLQHVFAAGFISMLEEALVEINRDDPDVDVEVEKANHGNYTDRFHEFAYHAGVSTKDMKAAYQTMLQMLSNKYPTTSLTRYKIRVKNNLVASDEWRWIANDDELSTTTEQDAGSFTIYEATNILRYIELHGLGVREVHMAAIERK